MVDRDGMHQTQEVQMTLGCDLEMIFMICFLPVSSAHWYIRTIS